MKIVPSVLMTIALLLGLQSQSYAQAKYPIPKVFQGKWVSMHTKSGVTAREAKEICNFNYDYQDSSWILDINSTYIQSVTYFEDVIHLTPQEYTVYSNNHIQGIEKTEIYELAEEYPIETKYTPFDFRIQDGKLYYTYQYENKFGTQTFLRCAN